MMTHKEMLDAVKSGAESKSAGITKQVEFTVKPAPNKPGDIIIGWVTEYDGKKYGDYLLFVVKSFENDGELVYGLCKAASLLAEQCLDLLEDLREAK